MEALKSCRFAGVVAGGEGWHAVCYSTGMLATPLPRGAATLALAAALFAPGAVHAHGQGVGRAVLRLAGDTAYLTATPDARSFPHCNQDGDSALSSEEVQACRQQLLADFAGVLAITNTQGQVGQVVFEDVGVPHAHEGDHAPEHVRFTLRYRWESPPESLTVRYSHGRVRPLTLVATKMTEDPVLARQRAVSPTLKTVLTERHREETLWGRPLERPASSPSDPPIDRATPERATSPSPMLPSFGLLALGLGIALRVGRRRREA